MMMMMMMPVAEAAEAKPAARGRLIKTALHQAVLDCRIHQVRLLVSKHKVNVDSKDVYGRTALMLACLLSSQEQGIKMVRIFIKAGAYPNVKDNTGRTALSYACIKGHEDMVRALLQDDSTDVRCADKDGNSPLMYAAMCGRPSITCMLVDKMLQYGMTVDTRNALGYTPFLLACKQGHYVSAHYLLTVGKASPLLRDNEYFLNAGDWLRKSRHLHRRMVQQQSRSLQVTACLGNYDRDNSTYGYATVTRSLDGSSLSDDYSRPVVTNDESSIDGKDAKEILVNLVSESLESVGSTTAQLGPGRVRFHDRPPGTAKLLALRASSKAEVPNINTIFSIYSDQYEKAEKRRQEENVRAQYHEVAPLHRQLATLVEASMEDVRVDPHSRLK